MNIIKAISRDRLVVLVTHEVELARFYASRIIELKDGKVEADYENKTDDNLDYRLDNKFYLRDFEKQESLRDGDVSVNFYGGADDDLNIDIVIKNGNIYIKSKEDRRIEVIDSNSAIEFVDDHYKEIDKSLYEEYDFDFDKVVDSEIKEKYSSIIGFLPSLARGFKKIVNYPLIKKLLFVGFLLAGVFITYSLSSIYASLDVKDEDFISSNKDYLTVEIPKISTEKYLEYENMDSVAYMFPKSANINMKFKMDFYYQTSYAQSVMTGSLTDKNTIGESDLISGRLPENPQEIAVDKLTLTRLLNQPTLKQVGISDIQQMLGKKLSMDSMKDFEIVGITDKNQPLIYADPSMFIPMIYNSADQETYDDTADGDKTAKIIYDYQTYDAEYTVKKGRLPENDYETIVPLSMSEQMPLNKEIDVKVNDRKLKVVGYYESPENVQSYLVNQNTIKYLMIAEAGGFSVAPADRDSAMEALRSQNINVKGSYDAEREAYLSDRSDNTKSTIILGIIMLAISLIEILLMTRSSFLSRIKEIGIYRAIGVKKTDIYKMFLGEIVAITTVSSVVGIGIMSYILYKLCRISYLASMFALNPAVILGAVAIVYVFNSLVGLIPVFSTMRKTPAAILARHDVD